MADIETYTPGPWRWMIHDQSCASLGVGDSPGMGTPLVMSVSPCRSCADAASNGDWQWGRCTTPNEANARLIAAAPELLEACKQAADLFEDDETIAAVLLAAIHAATIGRSGG